jgi:hypothetical protein
MSHKTSGDAAKAVVRRNTAEVQGKGNFDVFEEPFADDFVDHTPLPNMTPDKPGVRGLYKTIREAFPDFYAVIHRQTAEDEIVTTFKSDAMGPKPGYSARFAIFYAVDHRLQVR